MDIETCLVNILVGTRSAEPVETELLVSVSLPAHGAHDLNRQRGDTVGQNAEAVLLRLSIENLKAGKRDNAGLDVVLLTEFLDGVNADADLGTGGDEGDVGTFLLVEDVSTLDGLVDGRTLELGKVLAGQGKDAGSVLGGEGDVVGSAGLVAIGRAPHHHVGQSTEVGEDLNRLVGRAVLTKTNGVVGGNPEDTDLGERRKTDGTGSVRDEVEESATVGDNGAIGSHAVHDGTHGVLTDTEADVAAGVVAQSSGRRLEVDSSLPPGEVGASQIGGTANKLGDDVEDLVDDSLRQLSRGNGRVSRGVNREVLLPTLGKLSLLATDELVVLVLVLLSILGEELVPLLLSGSALGRGLVAKVVDLLGNDEALLGVEAELLLELLDIVGLEGRAVDTVGALLLGAVTNDGLELDKGGLVLDLLGLLEGSLNTLKVVVTVLDGQDLPAVGLVALENVLSEGLVGVTVNGDLVVIPDGNEVAELEMTSQGAGLRGHTLHQAAIAEEAVCVVVNKIEAGLVEDSAGVRLGNGKTNSIADTLAKRTSGDLNTRGVMGLGMSGGDAVNGLNAACWLERDTQSKQILGYDIRGKPSGHQERAHIRRGEGEHTEACSRGRCCKRRHS